MFSKLSSRGRFVFEHPITAKLIWDYTDSLFSLIVVLFTRSGNKTK